MNCAVFYNVAADEIVRGLSIFGYGDVRVLWVTERVESPLEFVMENRNEFDNCDGDFLLENW